MANEAPQRLKIQLSNSISYRTYVLHTGGNFESCDCVNRHNGRNILEIWEGGEQNQRENIMRTFTSYLFLLQLQLRRL